jgi:hypothetical protein
MAIIDILSTEDKDSLFFTVNTAVNSVPLEYPQGLPANSGNLYNPNKQTLFTLLDHITLLSIGIVLPLNFQLYHYSNDLETNQWQGLPEIKFSAREAISGNEHEINRFFVPFADYELNMNLYENFNPADISQTFQLRALLLIRWDAGFTISSPRISMINCPAALNGEKFYVPIFCKVMHTVPISAIP